MWALLFPAQAEGGAGPAYEAMDGQADGGVVYATAPAAGEVVYHSAPAGVGVYEALSETATTDVYATVSPGRSAAATAGTAEVGGVLVYLGMERQQAEAALQARGLAIGCHLVRQKAPSKFVLTMCVEAAEEAAPVFAHHILEPAGARGAFVMNSRQVICHSPARLHAVVRACLFRTPPPLHLVPPPAPLC